MPSKILTIQTMTQRDPRWKAQRLGTVNGTSIGSDGCVVTAACMLYTYYGKPVLPPDLDNFWTDNKIYESGNLFSMSKIGAFMPSIVLDEMVRCKTVPAPIDKIKGYIDQGKPVFVWVINEGVEHCTLAVGYEDNQIIVNDPWRGDRVKISDRWGDSVKAIIYANLFSGPVPATPVNNSNNQGGSTMNQSDLDRADGYNKLINFLFEIGKIPTNHSEDYLNDEGKQRVIAVVKKLAEDQKWAVEWDRVSQYLEFPDSRSISAEDMKRVVAGYKSRATEFENKLNSETARANSAEAEVSNQKDKVANVTADCQKQLQLAKAEYDALKNSAPDIEKIKGTYTAMIGKLQGELREAQKQGGLKDLQVTDLETKLNASIKGQAPKELTIKQLIVIILNTKIKF